MLQVLANKYGEKLTLFCLPSRPLPVEQGGIPQSAAAAPRAHLASVICILLPLIF